MCIRDRIVEASLNEVDPGVIEAAKSMGASTWQIIVKVLLPEAKPSLITNGAIAVTTILGYSAMAGFCGAGGLGAVAINYGYYRFEDGIMSVSYTHLDVYKRQGLGLAIVKHIVAQHGASISLESQAGKGTEIRVEFSDALKQQMEERAENA